MRDEGQPPQHRALLFLNSVWVLLHPAELQDQAYSLSSLSEKNLYPRRIESLTICKYNYYKGSTFYLVIWKSECWSSQGSNSWPPAPYPKLNQMSQPIGSSLHQNTVNPQISSTVLVTEVESIDDADQFKSKPICWCGISLWKGPHQP